MIYKEQYSKPATLAGRLNSDSQWVFDPIYNRPDQERDGGRLRVLIVFLHMSGIAQKLQQESLRASGGTSRLNDEDLIQRQRKHKPRLTDNLFN